MGKIQGFLKRYERQNVLLMTILLVCAGIVHYLSGAGLSYKLLLVIVALFGGIPIALRASGALWYKVTSIELLVTVAVIGALVIGEFNEAAIVVWLFSLGNILEAITLKKTRSAVKKLAEMVPQTALKVSKSDNAIVTKVDIDDVIVGDDLLVKTGMQIPVDGVVIAGGGYVNEASITGEAKRVKKRITDSVSAGTILENGTLTVTTRSVGEETTFGRIIELVEEAQDSKVSAQKVIDKFAKHYTPLVIVAALIVGLLFKNVRLGITILVLGCPGALVIGVPVSTVAGIGSAARKGILVKGSSSFQLLKKIDILAFDKTGTLTKGMPVLTATFTYEGDVESNHRLLYSIERESDHPLAKVIVAEYNRCQSLPVSQTIVIKGRGIQAEVNGEKVLVGNERLLKDNNVDIRAAVRDRDTQAGKSLLYLAVNGKLHELLAISDTLRAGVPKAFQQLKQLGLQQLVILSGDNTAAVEQLGHKLGISKSFANLLPADKAAAVKQYQNQGQRVAFIGDGINDSPALTTADLGIAMGNGTDVALDVSEVVLMNSDFEKLPQAISFARRVMRNMTENIIIAVAVVGLLFMGLVTGHIYMASGMFFHELSILVVIFNGMRLLR
ncbi:heavy metal translocating P-type ATPase [Liquorilactobacillus capillatus]|uniref:Cd(2+)-exporting ATPase n=1 Tax=Liquorilactobacillus capillatus DSM 19910 TaxID=1423731 RepID=A0A0R1M9F7_9LACO|nr:heavy metal translocating P-type ATPase [Liquorilactobacillus capillatus]KRL02420.1 cation-transporting ATPase [Liquorilactobacillus capillatus DSM 19910]